MTPSLKAEIENKAKELLHITHGELYQWWAIGEKNQREWIVLGRYCLAAEIKARIDENQIRILQNGRNTNANIREMELNEQLKELGENDE